VQQGAHDGAARGHPVLRKDHFGEGVVITGARQGSTGGNGVSAANTRLTGCGNDPELPSQLQRQWCDEAINNIIAKFKNGKQINKKNNK